MQEIKVILEAWRKAKERVPVVLRILTSEETDDSNEEVFNALPSDVKIWYYHSLWTYFTAETEIIPDCLEQVAKEGRYAGVCPNICAEVGLYQPFTGAQFIHYRMNEFVDKGLSGLLAYAVPATLYNAFNIEAAAEWTWNAKGRTPHEFALSYAIRKGYSDPELFAKWSDLHGPVAWDIYGSQWPRGENRGALERVSTQLLNGKLPELGFMLWGVYTKPWGDIKSEQQLKQGVKDVEAALELANEMDDPALVCETLVIQGYINSLDALWELRALVKPEGVSDEDKGAARKYLNQYVQSLQQSRENLPLWENCMPKYPNRPEWTNSAANLLGEMIGEMKAVAVSLGIEL